MSRVSRALSRVFLLIAVAVAVGAAPTWADGGETLAQRNCERLFADTPSVHPGLSTAQYCEQLLSQGSSGAASAADQRALSRAAVTNPSNEVTSLEQAASQPLPVHTRSTANKIVTDLWLVSSVLVMLLCFYRAVTGFAALATGRRAGRGPGDDIVLLHDAPDFGHHGP